MLNFIDIGRTTVELAVLQGWNIGEALMFRTPTAKGQPKNLLFKGVIIGANPMRTKITKAEANAFRNRWTTVNAEERKHLRRTSLDRKLQQLNALMAWGEYFGRHSSHSSGTSAVRKRWSELRRSYHG